jgi:hypothetical protein
VALLNVEANTGMLITESFAMWPGSSVSGLYFAHPESRYFSLGKIDRDQVADYTERKGMSVARGPAPSGGWGDGTQGRGELRSPIWQTSTKAGPSTASFWC